MGSLSKSDMALVDAVRKPLKVELDKAKVKQRMMIRQMMGLDPDVIPASQENGNARNANAGSGGATAAPQKKQ